MRTDSVKNTQSLGSTVKWYITQTNVLKGVQISVVSISLKFFGLPVNQCLAITETLG